MPATTDEKCTGHVIRICPRNKYIVKIVYEQIKKRHATNIEQALNEIIEKYGIANGIKIPDDLY